MVKTEWLLRSRTTIVGEVRRRHMRVLKNERGLRSDMKDFVPSCFHSASTSSSNANAAPKGGA
jgi:hypothetical protein